MMPSSRTPEGDSAKCDVCGAVSYVLTSDPPGDSVCPSCGAYLQRFDEPHLRKNFREVVDNLITELPLIANDAKRLATLPQFVTRNLTEVLAAHGASIWSFENKYVKLIDSYGEDPEVEQVDFVRVQRCVSIHQNKNQTRLLLAVPVTHSGRVIGAVQVVQRNVESRASQLGYKILIELVSRMAADGIAQLSN